MIEKSQISALNKFLNSGMIQSIYPMVSYIEAVYIEDMDWFVLRIHVDDPEMIHDNMYEKGLDPHYLIAYHLRKILPYLGIPKTANISFTVLNPEGDSICSSID